MRTPLDALLLTRAGRFRLSVAGGAVSEARLQVLDLELARLGFVLAYPARQVVAGQTPDGFAELRTWLLDALKAAQGADRPLEPLFRGFPAEVPTDTEALWWQRFVALYLQRDDQPCLWCQGEGTTHVLSPCRHVVCDRCFDGASYTACPVCQRAVDRRSPFFKPSPAAAEVPSPVRLRRLDLSYDLDAEARDLFGRLIARPQVLSPDDTDALRALVAHYGTAALPWLPAVIPVRENVAHTFGALLGALDPAEVIEHARPHLRTATDILRLIAVMSGADPALQPQGRRVSIRPDDAARWHGFPGRLAREGAGALAPSLQEWATTHPEAADYWLATEIKTARFKVARLRRPLRRALLALLDGLPEDAVLPDVARHRGAWVCVGEMLHPGEYASRYPTAYRAFEVARGAPVQTFASVAERLRREGDTAALVRHLRARPGELWRRADDLLRDAADPSEVVAALQDTVARVPVPLLLSLSTLLPPRDTPWPVRVFFPRGPHFHAPSAPDRRPPLSRAVTGPVVAAIEGELLARFSRLPHLPVALIDAATESVVVPFNERTAARGAVAMPRGSSVALPSGERLRLFLHWCQPDGGCHTDIDLSLAFYDAAWANTGVCSFYSLNLGPVAVHSGDLQDAPWPDGASEFIDLERDRALAEGHRYAVMIVTHYGGAAFSGLARAWAGVMRRTGTDGPTFDPATVELRFDVAGTHGVFAPLVVDLATGRLHWLDVANDGEIALNTVARSNRAITRIVPATLRWFDMGVRPSMHALALLHAAARCDEVRLRGAVTRRFLRREGEESAAFLARIRLGVPDVTDTPPLPGPTFAALLRGDVELPEGSEAWALFREGLTGARSASDLLIG